MKFNQGAAAAVLSSTPGVLRAFLAALPPVWLEANEGPDTWSARRRRENLAELAGWKVGPAELALPGIHPEFGPVTLEELLATWVVHDLNHIGQIARVLAKQYAAEVGPWQAYLPILSR